MILSNDFFFPALFALMKNGTLTFINEHSSYIILFSHYNNSLLNQ